MAELIILACVNLLAVGVAWGKLSAQVRASDTRAEQLGVTIEALRLELRLAHERIDRLLERLAR